MTTTPATQGQYLRVEAGAGVGGMRVVYQVPEYCVTQPCAFELQPAHVQSLYPFLDTNVAATCALHAAFVQLEKEAHEPEAAPFQVVCVIWKVPHAVEFDSGCATLYGSVFGFPELSVTAIQDITLACEEVMPTACRDETLQAVLSLAHCCPLTP